ncbi:MAG: glutamyl-tRNA reductase, partial [Planctomycetes bacterium]|nr:glutamyl-tRNA reductase [Planctomycetota bacterium]
QGAFRAGKRVRTRTRINAGAVSVAFAAVELARKFFADLGECRAMLVGAGETGTLAARHFIQQGIGGLFVINRSPEKAATLVRDLGREESPLLKAMDFSYLTEGLMKVDIVLTATSSPVPVILPEMVETARRNRRGRPLFIVDIAVPRDVHPDVVSRGNIYVYGLDELGEVIQSNLSARRKEISLAEKIIEHELVEFRRWMQDLELRPTVAQFRAYLEGLKEKELGFIRNKGSDELADAVEKSLQGFIKNLLRRSVSRLKSADSTEERFRSLDSLRRLFELDRPEETGDDHQDYSSEARAS